MVLVSRDLKVRYKRSALGFLWSFINPLMQMLVFTVIFKFVLNIRVHDYSFWVLAAILPWTFFQNSILDSAQSILIHFSLLKKVYLPREIIPITAVLSNLVHLGLSLGVFFVYVTAAAAYFSHGLTVSPFAGPMLLWLPVIVALQLLLNTGLALFIAAMNVYYEDVKFVVQILVNLLFYACPIIYPTSRIVDPSTKIAVAGGGLVGNPLSPASQHLFFLYRLNPMASLIFAYQKILLSRAEQLDPRPLDWKVMGITAVECIVVAVWGYRFFNRRKWEFAERL